MADQDIKVEIRGKDKSKQATEKASSNLRRFGSAVNSSISKLRDLTIISGGATKAFKFLSSAVTSRIADARKQLSAETNLAVSLTSITNSVQENMVAFKAWAGETQKALGVGDEILLQNAALITSMGKTLPQFTKRAVEAIAAFSQVTGTATETISLLVGRALQGGEVAWSRYGISVDKSLSPQRQAVEAVDQLHSRYVRLAGLLKDTVVGEMNRLENALGDFNETLGLGFIKTNFFQNVMGKLLRAFEGMDQQARSTAIAEFLDRLFEGIVNVAQFIVTGFLGALAALSRAVGTLLNTLSTLPLVSDKSKEALREAASGAFKFAIAVEKASFHADRFLESLIAQNTAADRLKRGLSFKIFDNLAFSALSARDNLALLTLGIFDLGVRIANHPFTKFAAEVQQTSGFDEIIDKVARFSEMWKQAFGTDIPESVRLSFEEMVRFQEGLEETFLSVTAATADAGGTLFAELADRTIKASEAIRNFARTAKEALLRSLGRGIFDILLRPLDLVIQSISKAVAEFIFGEKVLTALGQASLKASTAIVAATSKLFSSFWAPAAYLSAVATFGSSLSFGKLAISEAQAARLAFLQEGGLVNQPTLALIGEAQDSEAVLPLRPGSALEALSRAGGAGDFFSGSGVTIENLTIEVRGSGSDPENVGRDIASALVDELSFLTGAT